MCKWRTETARSQWMHTEDLWELLKKFSNPMQREAFNQYFASIKDGKAFQELATEDLNAAWQLYRKMHRSVRVLQFLHTHPSHTDHWRFILEKTIEVLEHAAAVVSQLTKHGIVATFLKAPKAVTYFNGLFQMLHVCGHVLSSSVDAFRIPSKHTYELPIDGNIIEGATAKKILKLWGDFQAQWDVVCSTEVRVPSICLCFRFVQLLNINGNIYFASLTVWIQMPLNGSCLRFRFPVSGP